MFIICRRWSFLMCCLAIFIFILQGIFVIYLLEDFELQQLSSNILQPDGDDREKWHNKYPIILWWTPFTGETGKVRQCGLDKCFFTQNRNYVNNSLLQVILFYGSDFNPLDLPLPRKSNHDWGLLHEESPKNNFFFCFKEGMELFNHTATFKRESDFPLTLQYLDSLESLTDHKYFKSTSQKDKELKKLSPVVYVQSDCNTPSERDAYVKELMKYIKIDSYGKCLHNKDLPKRLSDPVESMDNEEFWEILSRYKFSLAFENAVCDDYITEKLWRPLTVGSVPIYYGSPSIKDWLPHSNSVILATDFNSPKHLADYIHFLNSNKTAYESHLRHKLHKEITNNLLIRTMKNRNWGINNDFEKGNFIEQFECFVCKRINENLRAKQSTMIPITRQATVSHYGCPRPTSPLKNKLTVPSWWIELYDKSKYEVIALRQLMNEYSNFTEKMYHERVIKLLKSKY
ncbi:alpha-(1,3)-fucosyltransferase 10-like isoform X1 [Centruroides vittatus]|uniref:alpha-(1,3)-fucosyltransferase 10-like isoform X1 n=1 Tax=Centruroides vittatus TaxID=120091 RepID=UPI003510863C